MWTTQRTPGQSRGTCLVRSKIDVEGESLKLQRLHIAGRIIIGHTEKLKERTAWRLLSIWPSTGVPKLPNLFLKGALKLSEVRLRKFFPKRLENPELQQKKKTFRDARLAGTPAEGEGGGEKHL